jgi:hypothetical protein
VSEGVGELLTAKATKSTMPAHAVKTNIARKRRSSSVMSDSILVSEGVRE